jgi:hypothetical protein
VRAPFPCYDIYCGIFSFTVYLPSVTSSSKLPFKNSSITLLLSARLVRENSFRVSTHRLSQLGKQASKSVLQSIALTLFTFGSDLSLSTLVYSKPTALANRTRRLTGMLFTRGFSLTNFVIGSSALCFQIFVLYPWHEKLDEEFTELKKEHARLLEDTRERHRDELKGIREQLELLNERHGKSGKFW